MSYNLVNPTTGDLTRVAGRGKAEYGASSVRSGIYIPSSPVQAQEDLAFSVTFSEPMPDNDYQVIFGSSSYGDASGTIQCVVRDRSTTGFTGIIRNVGLNEVSVASGTFTWFAFKLYSDVEYSNIVNSMPSDASASNKLVAKSDFNYKSGTVNFTCGANQWNTVDVNFDSPMPDADYVVTLESGNTAYVHVQNVTTKSTNGFTIIVWNRDALTADGPGIINWQAYKIPH